MIPWTLLDTAEVPGGAALRLLRRGAEFAIFSGRIELMNSRRSGSEEALARLACERLQGRARPHLLIGGLGMGFTLRAALALLGPGARVTVAELVPAVVTWARGPLAGIFEGCLADARVAILEQDVALILQSRGAAYDAVVLDVDNGPDGLTRDGNDALYDLRGLSLARRALRPQGVLAVWSSGRDAAFTQRLRLAGFAVEEVGVRARGDRGPRHNIWLATNAPAAPARRARA
jgi:spermidine synthase